MQLRATSPSAMIGCGGASSSAPAEAPRRRSVLQFRRSASTVSVTKKHHHGDDGGASSCPNSPSALFPTKGPSASKGGRAASATPQHLCLSASQPQLYQNVNKHDAPPSEQVGLSVTTATTMTKQARCGGGGGGGAGRGGLSRTRSMYSIGGGGRGGGEAGSSILLAAAAAAGADPSSLPAPAGGGGADDEEEEEQLSVSSTLPSSASSSIASSSPSELNSVSEEYLVPLSAPGDEDDRREEGEDHHQEENDDDEAEFARRCVDFSHDLSRACLSYSEATAADEVPHFDTPHLRRVMEPHVARARIEREMRRRVSRSSSSHHEYRSISSSMGVPYTCLRGERPFLFDEHSFPLHEALAEAVGVDNLAMIHEDVVADKNRLFSPLLRRECRRNFHAQYDNFVTAFCIPLLHSMALQKGMFHTSSSPSEGTLSADRITYRYQAFPTISVVRPGEAGQAPHSDTTRGHSIGSLRFHVPLTSSFGTNALYTESHPGREDWHPLSAKSVGLGYLFDGARCLRFAPTNGTDQTRVSLDFHIMIYRERARAVPPRRCGSNSSLSSFGTMPRRDSEYNITCFGDPGADDLSTLADADGGLCTPEMLDDDKCSRGGPSDYYDEAYVELGVGGGGGGFTGGAFGAFPGPAVVRKNGNRLAEPDIRVGFPFDALLDVDDEQLKVPPQAVSTHHSW